MNGSAAFFLLCLFLHRSEINALQYGLLQDAALISQRGIQINHTSCLQCLCQLMTNGTFVSFNCHESSETCEFFIAYNATVEHHFQNVSTSHFYFLQLPPTSSRTTFGTSLASSSVFSTTQNYPPVLTSQSTMTAVTTLTHLCPNTVAGRCNATFGNDSFSLRDPIDLYFNRNGSILYVAEYSNNRVQAFQSSSSMGVTIPSSAKGPLGVYFDEALSILYISELGAPTKLSRWPSGQTLPASGTMSCNTAGGWTGMPYGVIGDRQGNIYASDNSCHTLVVWPFNSTVPRRIGGVGTAGASANHLNSPRHIYLDEIHSFIYVADTNNHRIQRFSITGNGTAVTVAGGNGAGTGLHQTKTPTGVYVSTKDGSIYVSERDNHRVTKWRINATAGMVVAGRANGTSGKDRWSLNLPFAVVLDRDEDYIYVADYNNHRIQRFPNI